MRIGRFARYGVVALALLMGQSRAEAQRPARDDSIRIQTEIVSVPVIVLDKNNRYVAGLGVTDFHLAENGVEQALTFFEKAEKPFNVLLLVDLSGSMNKYRADMGKALDVFIGRLRQDDQFAIATFADDSKLHFRVPLTRKRDFVFIQDVRMAGPRYDVSFTTTFDAVSDAIHYFDGVKGRNAIVFFGDGEPFGRRATAESNLRDAEEGNATIYTVRFGRYPTACVDPQLDRLNRANSPDMGVITSRDLRRVGHPCAVPISELPKLIARVEQYMNGLAVRSGGTSLQIDGIKQLGSVFTEIIDELGQTYTLGYQPAIPPRPCEKRRIVVKVDRPQLVVRSRTEVFYKGTEGAELCR